MLAACCGAANLASCLCGSCASCASLCGGGSGGEEGAANKRFVKLAYASFLFLGYVTCLLIKDGFHGLINTFHFLSQSGCEVAQLRDLCYGHTYIYRITFALFLFFVAHLILSIDFGDNCGPPRARVLLQTGFFGFKALALVGLLIFAVCLGNGFYTAFSIVCLGGAGLSCNLQTDRIALSFILTNSKLVPCKTYAKSAKPNLNLNPGLFTIMQIIILLDFAYSWNDSWVEWGSDEDDNRYKILLVVATLTCYISGLTLIGFMYHWFASGDCDRNFTFITITLIAGILYTLIAIRLEHASILPASIVFLYNTFQCFAALQSGSNSPECNLLWSETASKGLNGQVLVSSFVAIFSLMYQCLSSDSSAFSLTRDEDDAAGHQDAEDDAHALKGFPFFHFLMAMASLYMAMILTDWSLDTVGPNGAISVQSPLGAMWVKIIAQWVTILLYTWTLFAPLLLTDRDF